MSVCMPVPESVCCAHWCAVHLCVPAVLTVEVGPHWHSHQAVVVVVVVVHQQTGARSPTGKQPRDTERCAVVLESAVPQRRLRKHTCT